MLIYGLMNKDASLLTFHIGYEDNTDKSLMLFECHQLTQTLLADVVLLDIQIRSNALFYFAVEKIMYYQLHRVNLNDHEINV